VPLQAEPRQVLIGGDDDDAPAALPTPPAASAARADAPAPAVHAGHAPAAQPAPSAEGAAAQSAATASLLEAVTGVAAAKREEHAAPTSEADGSIEDLSDEEREAERAARRRKALAAEAGPVLMEADEMPAQAA